MIHNYPQYVPHTTTHLEVSNVVVDDGLLVAIPHDIIKGRQEVT